MVGFAYETLQTLQAPKLYHEKNPDQACCQKTTKKYF